MSALRDRSPPAAPTPTLPYQDRRPRRHPGAVTGTALDASGR